MDALFLLANFLSLSDRSLDFFFLIPLLTLGNPSLYISFSAGRCFKVKQNPHFLSFIDADVLLFLRKISLWSIFVSFERKKNAFEELVSPTSVLPACK